MGWATAAQKRAQALTPAPPSSAHSADRMRAACGMASKPGGPLTPHPCIRGPRRRSHVRRMGQLQGQLQPLRYSSNAVKVGEIPPSHPPRFPHRNLKNQKTRSAGNGEPAVGAYSYRSGSESSAAAAALPAQLSATHTLTSTDHHPLP